MHMNLNQGFQFFRFQFLICWNHPAGFNLKMISDGYKGVFVSRSYRLNVNFKIFRHRRKRFWFERQRLCFDVNLWTDCTT